MSENHVIPVVFNATQTIRTRVVYQYDYGQELHFVNFQGLPNVFEVHFSNSKTGEATIQIGTDNRVTVPDIYLTNPSACYAWVFLHDAETDGETKYVIEIPIQQRAQGVDGEVTPVQQSTVTQAIAVLNEAVEQTSLAQESAEAARDAAESAAETTGGYAEQAQAHAENASASENAAANSAQNAADEASRAQTSEINATNSASAAEESAQASAQSALSAENDARAAYAFAEQAEASAGNAERSASQAASILGETETARDQAVTARQATEAARDRAVSAQAAAETAVGQYNAMTATANILPEGSQPTAEIDHSGQNPVLNLGIPKGDKGDDYVLTDGDKNDIAGFAAELVHIPTNVSAFANDAGYLTAHQDISGKADKSEIPVNVSELVNDAGYLTQHQDISNKADKNEIPIRVSELENDTGYITGYTETDPTVPAWAKNPVKPVYTASEVGALPADTHIPSTTAELNNDAGFITENALPTMVSELENDAGYLTEHQDISSKADREEIPTRVSELTNDSGYLTAETDPTVPAWAKAAQKPTYTAVEVGALPSNTHIPSTTDELTNDAGFITAAALPVNVSELNNDAGYLTQHQDISGKADKTEIPTKVSDLTNDSGYLTAETDPTVPAWAKASTKPSYTAAEVGATTQQDVSGMIAEAIGDIHSFDLSVVQQLPAENISTHTIYLVPKTGETNDVYDEYVYINSAWEMIGNTQVDLSNYVTFNDVATSSKLGISRPGNGLYSQGGVYHINAAPERIIKMGTGDAAPIVASNQHQAAFYGLAKAAGHDEKDSTELFGAYTTEAQTAIKNMFGIQEGLKVVRLI